MLQWIRSIIEEKWDGANLEYFQMSRFKMLKWNYKFFQAGREVTPRHFAQNPGFYPQEDMVAPPNRGFIPPTMPPMYSGGLSQENLAEFYPGTSKVLPTLPQCTSREEPQKPQQLTTRLFDRTLLSSPLPKDKWLWKRWGGVEKVKRPLTKRSTCRVQAQPFMICRVQT